MRVVKPQGDASQEGYRGRWKSPQRDQYHTGKTRHGKSPMTRSKPLGPSSTSGKKHQREYGHWHASPDRRVETSSDQNQISQTRVHGTRGRRRRWHEWFHRRSDSYRLERPSCRVGIAPTEDQHLTRFTAHRYGVPELCMAKRTQRDRACAIKKRPNS